MALASTPTAAPTAPRRSHDIGELAAGFAVLAALAGMLVFAIMGSGHRTDSGYRLLASFSHVDGLNVGSDVRLAGITVGHVASETIDPKTFKATVAFTVRPDVKLPKDSAAIITSDSLLGGKYIALSPGGDTHMLSPGGSVEETQGSISLEQLLSKFIFSVTDSLTQANHAKANAAGAPDAAPAAPSVGDTP